MKTTSGFLHLNRSGLQWILVVLCMLMSIHGFAQSSEMVRKTVSASVVDAETGKPLPYVCIYLKDKLGTMTNEEGRFSILASETDEIRIAYIGYENQSCGVKGLPKTIKLKKMACMLSEVVVVPVKSVLKKAFKIMEDDLSSSRKSQYFYRQLTSAKSKELVEAFVEGRSAVNLRNLKFLSGHHGKLQGGFLSQSLIAEMNFHHPLELGIIHSNEGFWTYLHTPHHEMKYGDRLDRYYDYKLSTLYDEEGRKIYSITFDSKRVDSVSTLTGTLYIDAASYHALNFKGKVEGLTIDVVKDFVHVASKIDLSVEINYSHRRNFTEVESISYMLHSGDLTSKAFLFNIEDIKKQKNFKELTRELRRQGKKAPKIKGKKVGENMLASLDDNGFKEIMKANADFVERTTEESEVALQQPDSKEEMLTTRYSVGGNNKASWNLALPDTKMGNMVNRLAKLGQLIPQEKVYIHMDNTSYFLGDKIWFSAYLRRTSDDKPSNISGILYVELINPDGYVAQRKMIEMKNGRGNGDFTLDKEWYAGFYELRAYTRWQLNWGVYEREHSPKAHNWFINDEMEHRYFRDYEKLYSRVFPVYDVPKQSGQYNMVMSLRPLQRSFKKDPEKRELKLTLYPEGGNAVVGVPGRIAFEAAYSDGEYVDGKISLKLNGHMTGYICKTVNRGRGVFMYTPSSTKDVEFVFTASGDGSQATAKLKDIQSGGVAMRIERNDSIWNLHVSPSQVSDTLGLCIMHDARVKALYEIKDGLDININNDDLEPGVNQATVFDTEGRIYAERLFFVTRPEQAAPTLAIKGVKNSYQPYEQIELEIQKTLPQETVASGENDVISLSIHDTEHSDYLYDNASMMAEMLLSSEVKGFIPNPGQYFEKDDSIHREALDLLMMTQGWRRFNWEHMAVRGKWDLTQPDERTPIIVGNLYDYPTSCFYNQESTNAPAFGSGFLHGDFFSMSNADRVITNMSWDNINPVELPNNTSLISNSINQHVAGVHTHEIDVAKYSEVNKKSTIPPSVIVHSELAEIGEDANAQVEHSVKNGRFKITLPKFYNRSVFFVAASDTAKWDKNRRKRSGYKWIQGMPDPDIKQGKRMQTKDAEYSIRIDFPYPRFVKPYNFYQQQVDYNYSNYMWNKSLTDISKALSEVKVKSKHSRIREINDSVPAFMVDGYEAYNHALDAGMRDASPESIMRSFVGDYGIKDPYIITSLGSQFSSNSSFYVPSHNVYDPRFSVKYGMETTERIFKGKTLNQDSLYQRSNLSSIQKYDFFRKWNRLEKIDKYVIYTDYQPRRIGSPRYENNNLPYTTNVIYNYLDESERIYYRDRRYVFDGIAIPEEYYNPDYSDKKLPLIPDHRRTLYWNPNLKLSKDGKADVRFYNNANHTQIVVQAEGFSSDGTILHGTK